MKPKPRPRNCVYIAALQHLTYNSSSWDTSLRGQAIGRSRAGYDTRSAVVLALRVKIGVDKLRQSQRDGLRRGLGIYNILI